MTEIWMICPATTEIGELNVANVIVPPNDVLLFEAMHAAGVMVAMVVGKYVVEPAALQPAGLVKTWAMEPALGAVIVPASLIVGPRPKVGVTVSPPTQV